jgi:hypothetical protein
MMPSYRAAWATTFATEIMERKYPSRRRPTATPEQSEQRVYDALTDLSAYALALDGELHRMDDRLLALAQIQSAPEEVQAVLRERDELSEELQALRCVVRAFREQVLETKVSCPRLASSFLNDE